MQQALERIKRLPLHEQREILSRLNTVTESQTLHARRTRFIDYVRYMWDGFIEGRHHREMAKVIDGIVKSELKRVCINLGPRHTKSRFGSIYGPSYYFGHHPTRKIIQVGAVQELVAGFGREVRNIVDSPKYQELFPGVGVATDSRAADRWNTTQNGRYLARGVGGTIVGEGADLLSIDDPHTEQDAALAAHNPKVFDSTFEWYLAGPRQRLQPGGAILLTMTRWGKRDLQGQILQDAINNGSINDWKIFEFPAILNDKPLWPEYWSLEELLRVKQDLPAWRWLAQYQQTPTTDEGAIVKREWWREWESERLPEFVYIIQCWDTAFTAKTYSDYSACTTWGVFYHANSPGARRTANVMLVDAWRDRIEFPALKRQAHQLMSDWNPDTVLIEARSSGVSLIQELRQAGVAVEDVTPARGPKENPNNKLGRLNAVADLFRSGFVWYKPSRISEAVIEEFAEFPYGDHDDLMDSGVHALQRLRDGMFIGAASDEYQLYEPEDERRDRRPHRRLY